MDSVQVSQTEGTGSIPVYDYSTGNSFQILGVAIATLFLYIPSKHV